MRAAPGLDAGDAFWRQRARAGEELRILSGVNVVGDHREVVAVAQPLAQRVDQRRLAGANRPADAHAQRSMWRAAHERNSLVYWVSWRIEHQSASGVAVPRSSSELESA
jgi:hypothetical protein